MAASPSWTDVVTAIASIIGALGLIGVAIQIRQTRLSRDAEITIDLSRRWDEDLVRDARHAVTNDYATPQELCDALKDFKATKDPRYFKLLAEPNYYEDLAVMCAKHVLDEEIIRESFGETLYRRWQRWEIAVLWLREKDPKNYEHFETLAHAMRDDAPIPLGRRVRNLLGRPVRIWPPPWSR